MVLIPLAHHFSTVFGFGVVIQKEDLDGQTTGFTRDKMSDCLDEAWTAKRLREAKAKKARADLMRLKADQPIADVRDRHSGER